MKSFVACLVFCMLMASVTQAQPPQPQPQPTTGKSRSSSVTIQKGDAVRTGEAKPGKAAQRAGEGTFGESRTAGSLAPRPTQPTPTGQPPQ